MKGHDYSSKGLYFVTICCKDRGKFFGEIEKGKMRLSKNGEILRDWILKLERRFNLKMEIFQIMPDHVHFIIRIIDADRIVDANHDLHQIGEIGAIRESMGNIGAIRESPVRGGGAVDADHDPHCEGNVIGAIRESMGMGNGMGNRNVIGAIRESPVPKGNKRSLLSKVIGYLKMNVSKEIGRALFQRNYYERIIKDNMGYFRAVKYIKLNPLKESGFKFNG